MERAKIERFLKHFNQMSLKEGTLGTPIKVGLIRKIDRKEREFLGSLTGNNIGKNRFWITSKEANLLREVIKNCPEHGYANSLISRERAFCIAPDFNYEEALERVKEDHEKWTKILEEYRRKAKEQKEKEAALTPEELKAQKEKEEGEFEEWVEEKEWEEFCAMKPEKLENLLFDKQVKAWYDYLKTKHESRTAS